MIRRAVTDGDLEAWRHVRRTVVPAERTSSVAEIRRTATPEHLFLLAELDGHVVGAGIAGRSDLGGGFVAPRVLPRARRRGVGSALLHALAGHVQTLGLAKAGASVDEAGSLAFAERFGFVEVDREVEQLRTIGPDELAPSPPDGVEIVSVADRPELWQAAYDPLALQAFRDMAVVAPLEVSLEQWEREWITWPEGTFVALADGEVIGCAGLQRDDDRPVRAENALTAVRRDWRGRGVASALKRTTFACAASNGIGELYTWTQRGNADMRRLNEHLGYVTSRESIRVEAPLPLPS